MFDRTDEGPPERARGPDVVARNTDLGLVIDSDTLGRFDGIRGDVGLAVECLLRADDLLHWPPRRKPEPEDSHPPDVEATG